MVGETSIAVQAEDESERAPLLPDRHPTGDLFVCDIFDAAPKGDMASMEHPIFSLSTKPDMRIRLYEHGENYVEVIPSALGLATVHDRDVLIYCIRQLIAALNPGPAGFPNHPPEGIRLDGGDEPADERPSLRGA
jgi:Replication initiator protein A